jgi:hypothetical protein
MAPAAKPNDTLNPPIFLGLPLCGYDSRRKLEVSARGVSSRSGLDFETRPQALFRFACQKTCPLQPVRTEAFGFIAGGAADYLAA